MNKTKLALLSVISLAIVFLFSCSSDDSSNSVNVDKYEYCVFADDKLCLAGPFSSCESGGRLSNSCPYGNGSVVSGSSSSSSGKPSSSSAKASSSSSSVVPSSSSSSSSNSEPSSSSSILSSSSISSSSNVPSSSSVTPSSSSEELSCDGFVNGTKRLHYGKEKEQFCDERDGRKYVYVEIGSQTWMAENLNYDASGSKCGNYKGEVNGHSSELSDANTETCNTYGRLYDWATAMGLEVTYNNTRFSTSTITNHQGICPTGWHIPNRSEWQALVNFVDGTSITNLTRSDTAGKFLKAATVGGTDNFGFAALLGGSGQQGYLVSLGTLDAWWSTSEQSGSNTYILGIGAGNDIASSGGYGKSGLHSVRCVMD